MGGHATKINRLRRKGDDLTIAMADPGVPLQHRKPIDRVRPYETKLLEKPAPTSVISD